MLGVLLPLTAGPVAAQQGYGGQLDFRVSSADGNALEGVQIAITGASIEGERTLLTDAAGVASLGQLPPGPYTTTASLRGFNTYTRSVQLRLDRKVQINITLLAPQ